MRYTSLVLGAWRAVKREERSRFMEELVNHLQDLQQTVTLLRRRL